MVGPITAAAIEIADDDNGSGRDVQCEAGADLGELWIGQPLGLRFQVAGEHFGERTEDRAEEAQAARTSQRTWVFRPRYDGVEVRDRGEQQARPRVTGCRARHPGDGEGEMGPWAAAHHQCERGRRVHFGQHGTRLGGQAREFGECVENRMQIHGGQDVFVQFGQHACGPSVGGRSAVGDPASGRR
ncbi:hypothetical protein ACWEKT_19930 [Nocardia takedensis]|uniref:hypothetical protein n=1 Tax=Nocardia takedensis TaxID=259390 RepID=UPI001FE1E492|nr:hypothetical protein [Nocardia takedensis]